MKYNIMAFVFICMAGHITGCVTTDFETSEISWEPDITLNEVKRSQKYCQFINAIGSPSDGLKLSTWWSGECVNGLPVGSGTRLVFIGSTLAEKYVGSFVIEYLEAKEHGRGVITHFLRKNLLEALSGVSKNNEIRQYFRWHYEGDLQHGRRTGKGILSAERGLVVKGSFLNGQPHGEYFVTSPNGATQVINYENGKVVR